MIKRRFSAARYARHAGESAQRHSGRDVLQIVGRGADHFQPAIMHRAPSPGGDRNLANAGEILTGQAGWIGNDLGRRAFRHHMTAMNAGARSHVDDVIGGPDRFLVMLDHHHRIAEIAQVFQRLQQPCIVALMQPDRRLIEHIEHAGKSRADLRGQPDALAFAARKRTG